MKWWMRGIIAALVIVGFTLAVGFHPLPLALLLFAGWFIKVWLGVESRPVSVDE